MTAAIPQMRDQFRANMDWIEAQLGDGRNFCSVSSASPTSSAYMNPWYAPQNCPRSRTFSSVSRDFGLRRNASGGFGYGTRSEISTAEALEIGTRIDADGDGSADPTDPNGRKPGDVVSIHSDDDLADRHPR